MDFSQYSGVLVFMFIFTIGFWLLIFALTFIVPYWLVGAWIDRFKENRENKNKKEIEETVTEESVL